MPQKKKVKLQKSVLDDKCPTIVTKSLATEVDLELLNMRIRLLVDLNTAARSESQSDHCLHLA